VPLGEADAHGDWLRGQPTADGRSLHVLRTRIVAGQVVGVEHLVVDGAGGRLVGERGWDAWSGGLWRTEAGPAWCFGWRVAPDGRESYCPTWRDDRFGLEVLAAPDWRPVAFVLLLNQPPQLAGPGDTRAFYTPDGRRLLYVAGWGADRAVVAVDLAGRRVTGAVALGWRDARPSGWRERFGGALLGRAEAKEMLPGPAALSPDGRTLYATVQRVRGLTTDPNGLTRAERGDGVLALAVADLAPRDHLRPGRELWGDLAVSPDGRRLYATDRASASLLVLDAASGAEVARWAVFAGWPEAIERVGGGGGG